MKSKIERNLDHYLKEGTNISLTLDLRVQDKVSLAWQKSREWNRMSLMNTAKSGFFSSDRSIREYCEKIWQVDPLNVDINCEINQQAI